jgi:uncharacterized protein with GYD domain
MPVYVTLLTWTDQGIRNYRETVQRANTFRSMVEEAGGQVRELLWTMGEYDLVTVLEAPDDATATGLMLQVSSLGNVRTKSMLGFNADEMTDIIGRTS